VDQQLKSNLMSGKHWVRLVYMVFFAVCMQAAGFVMWVLVVLQFLFSLITGASNLNLRTFGQSLSKYIFESLQFLTYNSEEKPFPFSEWPKADMEDAIVGELQQAERDEEVVAPDAEVVEPESAESDLAESLEETSEEPKALET